jgi:hypothetical protein
MPEIQHTEQGESKEDNVLEFHWTPPLRRPRGPVQWSAAKTHDKIAIKPTTPRVTLNRKMIG